MCFLCTPNGDEFCVQRRLVASLLTRISLLGGSSIILAAQTDIFKETLCVAMGNHSRIANPESMTELAVPKIDIVTKSMREGRVEGITACPRETEMGPHCYSLQNRYLCRWHSGKLRTFLEDIGSFCNMRARFLIMCLCGWIEAPVFRKKNSGSSTSTVLAVLAPLAAAALMMA